MILILFLLTSLGLCYGWSDTEISRSLRNLVAKIPYIRTPLLCHECSSFWISLLLSFWLNPFENYTIPIISNIFCGFIGFFINLFFVRKHIIPLKDSY